MSCSTNFPTTNIGNGLQIVNGSVVTSDSSLTDFQTFLNNLIQCGNDGDTTSCTTISDNITSCNDDIQSAVQELNNAILTLETQNKQLRLSFTDSSKNANISSSLFRTYKENAMMTYIQNILLILGALFLFVNIVLTFYNETKITEKKI